MNGQGGSDGKKNLFTQCAEIGDGKRICLTIALEEVSYCSGCPECPPEDRGHSPTCAWANTEGNTIKLETPNMSKEKCDPTKYCPKPASEKQQLRTGSADGQQSGGSCPAHPPPTECAKTSAPPSQQCTPPKQKSDDCQSPPPPPPLPKDDCCSSCSK